MVNYVIIKCNVILLSLNKTKELLESVLKQTVMVWNTLPKSTVTAVAGSLQGMADSSPMMMLD